MDILKLTEELSKFGTVEVLKEDYVLTLLMTGENLSKFDTFNKILELIVEEFQEKFPLIETVRNNKNYFLIVLKPDK